MGKTMDLSQYSLASTLGIPVKKLLSKLEIWDAHSHIGTDKDGHAIGPTAFLAQMKANHVQRAVAFPLNTPDDPNFTKSNDQIIQIAKKHKEIIPFFRLDPKKEWEKEFDRVLDQEFQGIKLHPLSQNFPLNDPEFRKICSRAQDAKLVLLIHLGFGVKNTADHIFRIATEFPKLRIILGHAGFVDVEEVIKAVGDFENVLFDTSGIRVFDICELFQHLDDRRIAFGSDVPYFTLDVAIYSLLDTALLMGKSQKAIKRIFHDNLVRWLT
ncbi:MAG: amidohydrolase family protein [Nanoarchaeota archaeon]|nr:amidohydrolase family protein [Nanoarchaeota archaeon]